METKDLAEILTNLDKEKYKNIIQRAALNGYHDHKFDSIPGHPEYGETICPKLQLVQDLGQFPELEDIRQDVINGKYDEPADKLDEAQMRGWLLDDDAPDAMFEVFGFKVPTEQERQQWHNKKLLN